MYKNKTKKIQSLLHTIANPGVINANWFGVLYVYSIRVGAQGRGIDRQPLYVHPFAIVELHVEFGTVFDPQAFQGQVATHEKPEQL